MDSEVNSMIISLPFPVSVIAAAVTSLHVDRKLTMIGEAGGKEWRAYIQGKNFIALYTIAF